MIRLVKVTYRKDEYMEGADTLCKRLLTFDDSIYQSFYDIESRVYEYYNELSDPYGTSYLVERVELVDHLI